MQSVEVTALRCWGFGVSPSPHDRLADAYRSTVVLGSLLSLLRLLVLVPYSGALIFLWSVFCLPYSRVFLCSCVFFFLHHLRTRTRGSKWLECRTPLVRTLLVVLVLIAAAVMRKLLNDSCSHPYLRWGMSAPRRPGTRVVLTVDKEPRWNDHRRSLNPKPKLLTTVRRSNKQPAITTL